MNKFLSIISSILIPLFFLMCSKSFAKESNESTCLFVSINYLDLTPINEYLKNVCELPQLRTPLVHFGSKVYFAFNKHIALNFSIEGCKQNIKHKKEKGSFGYGAGIIGLEFSILKIFPFNIYTLFGAGGACSRILTVGPKSAEFTTGILPLLQVGTGIKFFVTKEASLDFAIEYRWSIKKDWRTEAGLLKPPERLNMNGFVLKIGLQMSDIAPSFKLKIE